MLVVSAAQGQDDGAPPTRHETIPGTTVGFDLVRLPAGASGEAELWMATTEVTWDLFDVFVYRLDRPAEVPEDEQGHPVDAVARPTRPYISVDRGYGHAGYPALSISLQSARAFCTWLSAHTGRRYRLPSVAEWEAACRAGAEDCNPDKQTLQDRGWYRGNSAYKTHPVASLAPNAWGLFDLAGNVCEWTEDGEGAGVLKGGSFLDGLSQQTCARGRADDPAWNASDPQLPKSPWWLADGGFAGFRVVCEGPWTVPEAAAAAPGDEAAVSAPPEAGAGR